MLSGYRVLSFSSFGFQHRIKSQGLSSSNKIRTALSGILLGIHFILFYKAVKISIPNATFLGTLAPFFTLFLELVFLNRNYRKFVYIGVGLALVGSITILLGSEPSLDDTNTLGNIYAILCSLCLGISFLIAEKVRETEGTIQYTRMLYAVAAATILSIGLFNNGISQFLSNKYEMLGFIFLAIVPTLLGHNIFYYCIKYTSPTIVATIPLGEPILASTIVFFIFIDQPITLHTIIGGAMCLFGIFIILKYRVNKKVTS